jgi:hypothetical protein
MYALTHHVRCALTHTHVCRGGYEARSGYASVWVGNRAKLSDFSQKIGMGGYTRNFEMGGIKLGYEIFFYPIF